MAFDKSLVENNLPVLTISKTFQTYFTSPGKLKIWRESYGPHLSVDTDVFLKSICATAKS